MRTSLIQKPKKIDKADVPAVFFCVGLLCMTVMYMSSAGFGTLTLLSEKNIKYLYFIFLAWLGLYLVFDLATKKRIMAPSLFGLILSIFLVIAIFAGQGNALTSLANTLYNNVLWIPFFCLGFFIFSSGRPLHLHQWFCIGYPLLATLCYLLFDAWAPRTPLSVNAVYYVSSSVLLTLLIRNKSIRYPILLVQVCVCLLSKKLGAVLGLALIGVVFLFFLAKDKVGLKKTLLYFGIGLLAVVLCTLGISFALKINLVALVNEAANGRLELYQKLLDAFIRSGPIRILFGNGFNATTRIVGLTAHSDFIEVLFDYGLVGFGILISFIAALFRFAAKLKRYDPLLSRVFAASIVMFIGVASISHLIFIGKYFFIFLFFWSAIMASERNRIGFLSLFAPPRRKYLKTTRIKI